MGFGALGVNVHLAARRDQDHGHNDERRDATARQGEEQIEGTHARLTALIDVLASEGRAVLVATHDVAQTLDWDAVVCVNGRQIAAGPPAEALSEAVLQATYGHALVRLPAGGAFAVVGHPHG